MPKDCPIGNIVQAEAMPQIEVRWVPLAPQDAQARSAQLRRLLIVGAQRLAQAEARASTPTGNNKKGGQAGD